MSKDYNNFYLIRWVGMKRFLILALPVFFLSCGKDDKGPSAEEQIITQYINDNSLTTTQTAEGVYQYVIVENATGNATGDVYSIYYTLSDLESGEVIDSHLAADGDPIKLRYNAGSIFPLGLDYGLAGIKEGETSGIIVPRSLGYGTYTSTAVSASSILLFEVEVITRESETDIATAEDAAINNYITTNDLNNTMTNPLDAVVALSDGVYYKRRVAGAAPAPANGDSVTIDYDGKLLDDSPFDALASFKYLFGSGSVIDGLDIGVTEMEMGEEATIFLPSTQAYGSSVRVVPESAIGDLVEQLVIPAYASRVKPYEVLIFDVTLQTVH